ncbi:MAG: SH3 domain-containing protein [Spirulina sp.]
MNLSSIAQFFLGVILGISILGVSGAAAGYYFFSKMAVTPSKPVFPEERPQSSQESVIQQKEEESQELPQPDTPEITLPTGAYRVRVNWPDGLSLRDQPDLEANRLAVIPYDAEMIVLKTTDDGKWDRVRLPGTNQEGWVKAGNADRIEED